MRPRMLTGTWAAAVYAAILALWFGGWAWLLLVSIGVALLANEWGVIAAVSGALAKERISLESMLQRGRSESGEVPVVLTTHETEEAAMRRALARIAKLAAAKGLKKLFAWQTGVTKNGANPNFAFRVSAVDEIVDVGMLDYAQKTFKASKPGMILVNNPWGESNEIGLKAALDAADLIREIPSRRVILPGRAVVLRTYRVFL